MIFQKDRKTFYDYFWFNQFMLECCGVLALPERGYVVNFSLITLTLLSVCFLVLPGIYMIIFNGSDIDATEKVNIIAGESLEVWVGALKVIVLLPQRKTMLSMFRRSLRLWKQIKNEEELSLIASFANRGYRLVCIYGSIVFFALINLLCAPFSMEYVYDANGTMIASKSLPYTMGIVHENKQLYNLWWALQAPAGLVVIMPIIGIDTATAVFVLHACGHLQILQSRFQSITVNENKEIDQSLVGVGEKWKIEPVTKKEIMDKECRIMIIECIRVHQEIIRFCEEIEQVFRIVILIQMILSISAICGFGFNLLAQEQNRVKYGVHFFAAVLQLFLFCWPPDNLQTESSNIALEAFDLRWYNWVKRDKNNVGFIIMRSQKPLLLTAGKFSDMSLITFSSILSSAFSFFSILRKTL